MNNRETGRPEIDPLAAVQLFEAGAYLLDVRESEEWNAGHISAAAHLPLGDLEARWREIPTDRPVVVVCRSGHRSGLATDALVAVGIDARNLRGGMFAWAEAGEPVVVDDGTPGTVI